MYILYIYSTPEKDRRWNDPTQNSENKSNLFYFFVGLLYTV